jgi:hypothetical protein
MGRGFHLYAELLKSKAVRVKNGSLGFKKNRSDRHRGSVALKKCEKRT